FIYIFRCDLRILSDANTFFIETIIEHLRIKHCFSEINTNPSHVDEKGCLRISPFVDFRAGPHGCPRCPPNMCKGMVIEKIQASIAKEGSKRMIYLGNGAGDFCPSLKLRETHFMMPRKDFPVWELICENREVLRADVHESVNGEDMEIILLQLIEKIKVQEKNGFNSVQMLSVDCKLETVIPMAAYEASSVEYVVV
ncbi:pyridoxal phosphate phosphatase-related protein, partial [Striga asiatica]